MITAPHASDRQTAAIDALLYLAAPAAALTLASSTSLYWDSFGYLAQALNGQVGGLGLGRPVFVLVSHALARTWLAAGGSVWSVETVVRAGWTVLACTAAPLTRRLARHCGLSSGAAILAGLAVACSPAMAHATTQVLTDAPAVVFLLWPVSGLPAPSRPRRSLAGPPSGPFSPAPRWAWRSASASSPS